MEGHNVLAGCSFTSKSLRGDTNEVLTVTFGGHAA
jgi:hypothetical protein